MSHGKRFHIPAIGTKLPPLENDLRQPHANDQDAVNEYLMRAGQQDALNKTQKAIDEYLGTGPDEFGNETGNWHNWLGRYQSGRMFGPAGQGDPEAPPLQPPAGFMAVVIDNNTGGVAYEAQQVGPPACDLPEYTKITAPQH